MRLILFALLLAACAAPEPEPPESFTTVDTQLYDSEVLETRKAFVDTIVGHRLRGDGVDVTVARDGLLIGTQFGKPFSGQWTFRDRKFCYSLTGHPWTAKDRKCFRAALLGREVHLVPLTQ